MFHLHPPITPPRLGHDRFYHYVMQHSVENQSAPAGPLQNDVHPPEHSGVLQARWLVLLSETPPTFAAVTIRGIPESLKAFAHD